MAADVADDPAVLLGVVEPVGAPGADAMRAERRDLEHGSDRSLIDQLAGEDRRLGMHPLAVVDGELVPGALDGLAGRGEVVHRRDRGLVGEEVLAGVEDADTEPSPLIGDRRARDESHVRVVEHLLLAGGRPRLREPLDEVGELRGVGVVDERQRGASLEKLLDHAEDVAVVEPHGGEHELTGADDRLRQRIEGVGAGHRRVSSSFTPPSFTL